MRKRMNQNAEEGLTSQEEASPKRRVERAINKENTMKMKYQYTENSSFRFPVIPDEPVKSNESENHPIPPYTSTKKLVSQAAKYTQLQEQEPLIRGYKERKRLEEMDEVPAFMRSHEHALRSKEETMKREEQMQEAVKTPEIADYTRPDELDRVFRKIAAVSLPEENTCQEEEAVTTRPELPEIPHVKEVGQIKETESAQELIEDKPAGSSASIGARTQAKDYIKEKPSVIEPSQGFVPLQEEDVHPSAQVNQSDAEEEVEVEVASVRMNSPINQHIVPPNLLDKPTKGHENDTYWLQEQRQLLEQTLKHFKIAANVVNITQGPAVTRFEIQPELGVRVNKIRNLSDDIKLNMAAKDIRIEAPIPGKNTIGIEIPNKFPQIVGLQEVIKTSAFKNAKSPLTIALGLTIEGDPLITNIEKMPHGLIAGATGSGKSVCINTILISLLYKSSHEDLKFLLIDPKMVELAPYNGIPHLLSPVITDAKAATVALKWAVTEMEERYNKLAAARVRNIQSYNEKLEQEGNLAEKMPYIVIVIDELADLMMVSPQEVEDSICRIAQKARACGIHLLIATQRPSVDVITGLIKSNIPSRIAFSVSSQIDSRTILDSGGAQRLLGKGDMLFIENGSGKSVRLQGPFVSDEEIDRITNHFRAVAKPTYLFGEAELLAEIRDEDEDELLDEVIDEVLARNQASTSLLQRCFRIGYNRAARLIDTLEASGIISGPNGSKPREVLVTKAQVETLRNE